MLCDPCPDDTPVGGLDALPQQHLPQTPKCAIAGGQSGSNTPHLKSRRMDSGSASPEHQEAPRDMACSLASTPLSLSHPRAGGVLETMQEGSPHRPAIGQSFRWQCLWNTEGGMVARGARTLLASSSLSGISQRPCARRDCTSDLACCVQRVPMSGSLKLIANDDAPSLFA